MIPLTLFVLLATNPSHPTVETLWRDPGAVEKLDFVGGPGGRSNAPQGPFTFVKEDLGGTTPKIKVTDAKGVTWIAKWGSEVHPEVFASRMVWAAGYFVAPSYYVPEGKIIGAKGLTRAKGRLDREGNFKEARFKWKEPKFKGHDWAFINNPFLGTKELHGLKIMLMLTSNWDSKDARPHAPALEFRHGFKRAGMSPITRANDPFWNVRASDNAIARHNGYLLPSFICAINQLVMDDPGGHAE